jgi:signal transduction histidine kinase/ligand-binding sensor domain-containing protein
VLPRRTLIFLALALSAEFSAWAERLPFRNYTTTEGLAGDAVWDLLPDSRGYLWIATSSGLSRFDGQVFRNYDTAEGLPSPRVRSLLETRAGTIWVLTAEGVARLDPQPRAGQPPFRPEPLPYGIKGSAVGCLVQEPSGRLWICTRHVLLAVDDPETGFAQARRVELPGGMKYEGGAMAREAEGSLWVPTYSGLLRLLPDGGCWLYSIWPSEYDVRDFAVDRAGRLWLGTANGIFIFWPEPARSTHGAGAIRSLHTPSRRPAWPGELPSRPGEVIAYDKASGLADSFIYSISVRSDGTIWVGTRGGVSQFSAGALHNILPAQGLPEPAVTAAVEDRDGTLWLGTESRGLARLARSGFTAFGTEDGLAHDSISSLFEDERGELYVVTFSRELHRFDGRRFQRITPRSVFRKARAGWGWNEFFLRDRKGTWWVPTADGLYHLPSVARPEDLSAAKPLAHFGPSNGLPGRDVFRVFEDRKGDVWASLIAAPPLVRIRPGSDRPEVISALTGAETGGAPTAFAEDREGNLWMGFYLGGLARVRGEEWRFFGAADGVPPDFVTDLYRDRAGRLWMATLSGGVARIDDAGSAAPRFVRYTVQQGLTTNSTRCLTEDNRGRIYIGTSRGIDRLDPHTGRVRSLTNADGLPNNLAWTCYADRHGRLWFGTLHGLARFDPAVEPPRRPPVVLIAGLEARGLRRPLPELGTREVSGWVLEPKQDALRIDYLALAASDVLFQHKLEGRGEDWSTPTAARSVAFPQLAPGRYRLLVRAVTHDGLVSAVPAAVSFELLPPFWRRPWFFALMATALAAAIWAAYCLRVRRLVALERVRTRIAADIHDDVGASLARIGLLGDLARDRMAAEPRQAAEMLDQIGTEARELAETTSDIVWAVDPRKDDLGSLLVRLRRCAADLLEAKGIGLRFESPPDATLVGLAPETRRGLYLLLKEAVHNIARHSRATEATVRVEVHGGAVVGEVRDDGIGIDPQAAADAESVGRRGLVGMHERARLLGGELRLVSAPGEGTRLTVRVPLARSGLRFFA